MGNPRTTCGRCGEPRGDSSHPQYCRDCKRTLARDSYARRKAERGNGKAWQPACSRCGGERTGRHPSYCQDCWRGPILEERFAAPCSRCGRPRSSGDRTNANYCYRCWYDWYLRRKFGITLAEFEAQLERQGGLCAICRNTKDGGGTNWHPDHDHVTGKFRGVLCALCNRGLGQFHDSGALLRRAADYLEGRLG
jgi:hypothetical protein